MTNTKLTNIFNNKIAFVALSFMLISMVIIANAFRIQLLEGEVNLVLASQNAQSSEIIRAPRGIIYDVEGKKLVSNDAAYNIYVLPAQIDSEKAEGTFAQLAEMFDADAGELQQRYETSGFNAEGQPVAERVTLIYNIDYDDFLTHLEDIESMAGVYISSETKRTYLDSQYFAHVVGYLGDINAEEVEETNLDPKAQIGKTGIEESYDQRLRGEDGLRVSEQTVTNDENSWIPKSYRYGDNVYLSLDYELQKKIFQSLEENVDKNNALGGAAVVMETDTGKVRALVNYPSYDLNLFAEGISQGEFEQLLEDEQTPLLNRSVAMQIPTGSTFKVFMAAALQQEGAISRDTVYPSGCFSLPGGYELCEADNRNFGNLDMIEALARSSNPYFCQASVELARVKGSDQAAIRSLNQYFEQLGLGQNTGIELAGEQPGTMPTPELKQSLQGEPWYLADMCNTAIGQGLVSSTPVQVAQSLSAIANGGDVYKPQLVEQFEDANGEITQLEPEKVSTLEVEQRYLNNILQGMDEAVDYGTARQLSDIPADVIAKTGSSEAVVVMPSGEIREGAHSWVMGVFEHEGQQYTFVAVQQFGGRGFRSLPIATDLINCATGADEQCRR